LCLIEKSSDLCELGFAFFLLAYKACSVANLIRDP